MKKERWRHILLALILFIGLALSIVSFLHLCSAECRATEDWKLFGLPLGPLGIFYFVALLLFHFIHWRTWVSLGLAAGLGAEIVLIAIQKYSIGHWCPICLAIAATLGVAALVSLPHHFTTPQTQGGTMPKILRNLSALGAFTMGFLLFFGGLAKESKIEALETNIRDQIAFGKLDSPTNIYLFTDWACSMCRALEPKIAELLPTITENARFTFVDIPIHPETLNYSPYNLSFMIHNKPQYLALRDALTKLSVEVAEPNSKQIKQLAKEVGVNWIEMHFAEVALGLKYWSELQKEFNIDATPIMVIVNAQTKKGKKLEGLTEITSTNILHAIESLR